MQKFYTALLFAFLFFVACKNAKKEHRIFLQDTAKLSQTQGRLVIGVVSDDEAKFGYGCNMSYGEKGKQGIIFFQGTDPDVKDTGKARWIVYMKINGQPEKLYEISNSVESDSAESEVFENKNFKVEKLTYLVANSEESDTWEEAGTLRIIDKKTGITITVNVEGGGAC